MANDIIDLKKELIQYKYDLNLMQKINCSDEENEKFASMLKDNQPLPDDVFQYKNDGIGYNNFYRIYSTDLNEQEINEYILYEQLKNIQSIKRGVTYFVVLSVISMFISFLVIIASIR